MMPLSMIYDGTGQPPPERTLLRAGRLTLVYEAGTLRDIRMGDQEIVRGIYAAVRDHNWSTIPAVLHDVTTEVEDDHFRITFTSVHQQGSIHFTWRGTIEGSADSIVKFVFDGTAQSAFKRNRVGFCVLHPMEVAGIDCLIEHPDGSRTSGVFPRYIAPHQPFLNIRAMTHEVLPGVQAEVRMEGDIFETEDQRNWIDASFKTYCTPLSLPFPAALEVGSRIQQSVTLRLLGQPSVPIQILTSEPTVYTDPTLTVPLPPIGLGHASHHEPLTADELDRLRGLHPAHLRFDWRAPFEATALAQASQEARALGCGLELALHLSAAVDSDLAQVRAAVDKVKPEIVRWLVFQQGTTSTPREVAALAREALSAYAPLGAGTDAFFTELNRERPPADLLDWVTYSINPQVHAFDNASLTETLLAQGETVASTRQFAPGCRVAVSPVTLKMRWNPNATANAPAISPAELPAQVDVRQLSLCGAGWTLGSIKSLALAGADSVTYYETTGWLGVMEREAGSPLPERFASVPGGVFPLYHVLADINAFRGGEVVNCRATAPLRCDGLVLQKDGQLRILLANYTGEMIQVRVEAPAGVYGLRILDETSADSAIRDPQAFRAAPPIPVNTHEDTLTVILHPYAVAVLDRLS